MVAVNTVDGIKYGFRILGYLLAVFLAGGLLVLIGAAFGNDNILLTGIFWIVGITVIYAGALGLLYKVIGDGVEVGNRAANNQQPARGQPQQPPQQPPQQGGQQPQQGGRR
jgi:hypothetical protein